MRISVMVISCSGERDQYGRWCCAVRVGVTGQTAVRWVRAWRQWLLLLDPTGAMEARVRLGLSPQPHGKPGGRMA